MGDPKDLLMPNVTVLSVIETFPVLNLLDNAMALVTKKRAQKLTPDSIQPPYHLPKAIAY